MILVYIGIGVLGTVAIVAPAWLYLRRTGRLCAWNVIEHDWRITGRAIDIFTGGELITHRCHACGDTRACTVPPVKRGRTHSYGPAAPGGRRPFYTTAHTHEGAETMNAPPTAAMMP